MTTGDEISSLTEQYKGKSAFLTVPGGTLRAKVIIRDVRKAFGRVDLLVAPECGDGEMWVRTERVFLYREMIG